MSKESHSFSVDVACKVGAHGAILLQHLLFLQRASTSDGQDISETWVRRSIASMRQTYPYMTDKEIRGETERLERAGYILSKIDNKDRFDRARSYQISRNGLDLLGVKERANAFDKRANGILQNGESHLTKGQMLIGNCTSFISSFVEEEPPQNSPSSSTNQNFTLEAKSTHDRRTSPAPPPDAGSSVDIEAEIQKMSSDPLFRETFSLVRKIPAAKFDPFLAEFRLEAKGTGAIYWRTKEIRDHFLNWAARRAQIAQTRAQQNPSGLPSNMVIL